MAIIDITSEIYSDVAYTRAITARQLTEIDNIVALRVADRETTEFTIWVRIDDSWELRDGRSLVGIGVTYDDGYETDQYFRPNQKIEIALVG